MPSYLNDTEFAHCLEHIFVAALDLKLLDWSELFLKALCNLFPNSAKSIRFLGMWHEAKGETLKAQEIYQELMESCPSDA